MGHAIRARLAIASAGVSVELREVVLRDKPSAFMLASPTAIVPCLVTPDGISIDESYDVMLWALGQNDPDGWLQMPQAGHDLILEADGPFKSALDHTKYASRYPSSDAGEHRTIAAQFLGDLDNQITGWMFERPTLADYAILPFVRQFAFIEKAWFDAQPWPDLQAWLRRFLDSDAFADIMHKYPQWAEGDTPVQFP